MSHIITGVDIGGTHITACPVDIHKAELHTHLLVRHHVNASADAAAIIKTWATAIKACGNTAGSVNHIGIAMPGPFDYENGISWIKGLHKYESLYGLNIKNLLAEELGIAPQQVRFINDATAYLLGEMRCGCAKGFNNVAAITLGTGLGSAYYFDNRLHDGDLFMMNYKDGKAEDYISSRWFVLEYERLTAKKVNGVKEIAAIAGRDDIARQLFKQFGYSLAEVLVKKFATQNPELIVIGGKIALAWEQFIPFVIQKLEEANCPFNLRQSLLGEEAALAGASYVWLEK